MYGYFDYGRFLCPSYRKTYEANKPFPHIIIDNAIKTDKKAELILQGFPRYGFFKYNNHFEKKSAQDKVHKLHRNLRNLFSELNSSQFIEFLESLTGIKGLIPDPHFRGGGCHQIETGGKLAIHADFSWHPRLKLFRRVNLLLYLNKDWRPEWGGFLEFWEEKEGAHVWAIPPIFNRMVIFDSTDKSLHGHPYPLLCPPGITRKSIACYYYAAEPPEGYKDAHSTKFEFLPGETPTDELKEFQETRSKFRESK